MEKGYTVILSPDPVEGGCTVTCPAMPGAIKEGDSREAALRAIAEVMALWLDVAAGHGEQPLVETPQLVAQAIAHVLDDRAEEGWDLEFETTTLRLPVSAAA